MEYSEEEVLVAKFAGSDAEDSNATNHNPSNLANKTAWQTPGKPPR
jgi:hypothetical protein